MRAIFTIQIGKKMSEITAVILDDEYAAAENIKIILETYCPEVKVLGMANSITDGIQQVNKTNPDIVFLDISMPPEGTGFDFLSVYPQRKFHVIFVTAYEQYSLKAIKEHAFDYLLKPVDYKEVIRSLSEYQQLVSSKQTEVQDSNGIITLATEQGIHVIKKEDVLYCQALGNYCKFHIANRSPIVISKTLKFADSILNESYFHRVHRSYIVNSKKITKFSKEDGGTIFIDDDQVPVSKKYFDSIYSLL